VTTLAFVVINVIIMTLWSGKPRDIQEPIDIHGHAILSDTRKKTLREARRNAEHEDDFLPDDVMSWASLTVSPVVGALFGGVHCFALWFPFPTGLEAMLWKVSAIYCTVFCIIVAVGHSPGESEGSNKGSSKQGTSGRNDRGEDNRDVDHHLKKLVGPLAIIGYLICRSILIVLTFISLRLPPSGIYEATNWTSFIPHFG